MDREIIIKYPRLRKYLPFAAGGALLLGAAVWAVVKTSTSVYHADSHGMSFGDVAEQDFSDYIRISGRVETGTVVQVSALESGIVETRWVEEGAFVNAGDIILTLHNPNLRQQILDSESQLAERQNMLRDTEIAMEKERLQLRQDILSARMESNRLQRVYHQQKTLYDEHLVSREEYLKSKEDYELAAEKMKLLSERIRQDSLYRSVQVAMMRESLDNMRQNFALVRQRADNLNVRASHSGQLGTLDAELGQNIPMGQQIGQINVMDNYKIVANIDEHYIDRVETGITGTMERSGKTFPVHVAKVYPEVSSSQFRADLAFDSITPSNIRVGQTYYVNLCFGEPTWAVVVPRGSFFQTTGGKWAYVVDKDGHSATRRQIKIGRQNPRFYEVIEGLAPGERIITSSYAQYGDADKITF